MIILLHVIASWKEYFSSYNHWLDDNSDMCDFSQEVLLSISSSFQVKSVPLALLFFVETNSINYALRVVVWRFETQQNVIS